MTEGHDYPIQTNPAPEQKLSLWQKFKRWPLIARIGAIGCGGLIGLFALLVIFGLALQAGSNGEEAEAEEEEGVEVPDVSDRPGDEAQAVLEDAGFVVELEADEGPVVMASNWVAESTSPEAGEFAEEESGVVITVVRPEGEEEPDEDEDDEGESWQELSEQRQAEREQLAADDPLAYIEQEGPSGVRDVSVYETEGTLYISFSREVVMGSGERRAAMDAYDYIGTAWDAWQEGWDRLELHAEDPDAGMLWHNAGYSAGSVEMIATENVVRYETIDLRDTGETHFDR